MNATLDLDQVFRSGSSAPDIVAGTPRLALAGRYLCSTGAQQSASHKSAFLVQERNPTASGAATMEPSYVFSKCFLTFGYQKKRK